jgi:hypothetical protein
VLNEIETGSTEESKLAAISFLSDKVIKQEKGHYSRDANIQKLVLDTVAKETVRCRLLLFLFFFRVS